MIENWPGKLIYELEIDNKVLLPNRFEYQNNVIVAIFDGIGKIFDEVVISDDELLVIRNWEITCSSDVRLMFGLKLPWADTVDWTVPSVMYNGNKPGSGRFSKGGVELGLIFREDRVSIPSASVVSNENETVVLYTEPSMSEKQLSSVKTIVQGDELFLSIYIPSNEERVFAGKFYGKSKKLDPLKGPFTYSRRFFVVRSSRDPYAHVLLSRIWSKREKPGYIDFSLRFKEGLEYIHNEIYYEKDEIAGFVNYVTVNGLHLMNTFSAGFLGQNVSLARISMEIGKKLNNELLINRSRKVVEFFRNGQLPNGLFNTSYQIGRKQWSGYQLSPKSGCSTRMMAEAGSALLKIAKLDNDDKSFKQAFGLGQFFKTNLPESNNPGKWWSPEGKLLASDGTNGAWILLFLTELHKETNDCLNIIKSIGEYFTDQALKHNFYGDTLDANCIDKESGIVLLKALLATYGLTRSEKTLLAAIEAARFCDTWIYTYDVPFDNCALAEASFKSTGYSAVSVSHHHLDSYGISLASDYALLSEITGDQHWRCVALHLIAGVNQLVSKGFQPEQINHTDWSYWGKLIKPRGTYYSRITWVPAIVLGSLLQLKEKGILVFDVFDPDILEFRPRKFRKISATLNRLI